MLRSTSTSIVSREGLVRWVGQAWEETAAKKEMVMRAFRKCGVSLPIDGSQDAEINIREFDNYTIDEETYSDDDGEDPFADFNDLQTIKLYS